MQNPRLRYVIGPDGSPLTLEQLPKAGTTRWVTRRKAEVVLAVKGGLLTLQEACDKYSLSTEEYLSWQTAIETHGFKGLRSTWVQEYKSKSDRPQLIGA